MNTNFQVRKVTGYDPGYPVGRRRPGRLEARPLKFLFLVVGFLFFFVGFGCEEKVKTTGVQVADDLVIDEAVVPDYDVDYISDYTDIGGVDATDMPEPEVEVPDYDDYELSGVDETVPIYDDEYVSDDDVLLDEVDEPEGDDVVQPEGGEYDTEDDYQLSGVDETVPIYDDEYMPDDDALLSDSSEEPDYDTQLSGVAPEDLYLK